MNDPLSINWNKKFAFRIIILQHLYQQTQQAITCSKLTIETLEQGVKYVQS